MTPEILGHEDMGWLPSNHHDVKVEAVVVVVVAVMAVVNQREDCRALKM